MTLTFQLLDESLDLSHFDCGSADLNRFVQSRALNEMRQRLSTTLLALSEEGCVVGFYSVSMTEIATEDLPRKMGRGVPYAAVPGVRIGRLAVDLAYQGKGRGGEILKHALLKALKTSHEIGCKVVVVDAKDDSAVQFYSRYGFQPLSERPLTLVLKISTLIKGLNP